MEIKIITDSGCDLPQEIIDEYSIEVLPIFVLEGEREYRDKIDIMPEEVLKNMETGSIYKTSQIIPELFINKFTKSVTNNESIICIPLSRELSGTYDSAIAARKMVKEDYPNAQIDIMDIKAVSGGQGLIVLETAKMIKDNLKKKIILDRIEKLTKNIEHIFTIGDIKYLYRGGRISKTQNIVGGILGIKPILHVKDGKLEPLDKVRGKNKVLKAMVDIIRKRKQDAELNKQTVIITHGNDLDSAEKLKNMMEEEFEIDKFIINSIGAVIGAHAGPGTLAVFFLKENI